MAQYGHIPEFPKWQWWYADKHHPLNVVYEGPDYAVWRWTPNWPWGSHNRRITWFQRWLEAWWCITGKWTLHRAWQRGVFYGSQAEYQRVVVMGGDFEAFARAHCRSEDCRMLSRARGLILNAGSGVLGQGNEGLRPGPSNDRAE